MLPTLYKKDSTGSTRVWAVQVEDDEVVVSHGLLGGAIVENRTRCVAKNVGRANATTPREQALAEAQAKWKKQIERERYTEDRSGEDNNAFLAPMLARDYTKVGHQFDWSQQAYAQPKLDGSRQVWDVSRETLWSRKGTQTLVPTHIIEQLKSLNYAHSLDGELYIPGLPLNQIMSATKKRNALTDQLEFHIFDVAISDPFHERYEELQYLRREIKSLPSIKIVDTLPIKKDEVLTFHNELVEDGYEGLILREGGSTYAFGQRAKGLMKYKAFKEAEYLIIGVNPDVHGKQGILECVTPEGKTFGCRSRGKDEYREWLLENKSQVIGRFATVRYFALTEYGVPQFGVSVAIGDEK